MNDNPVALRRTTAFLVFISFFTAALAAADARAFFQTGEAALVTDDYYSALDAFHEALRLNPLYVEARLGLAEALFRMGEYAEAEREMSAAKPLAEGNEKLSLLEARILTALMRYDEAVAIYNSILQRRPHDPAASRGLAEVYALTGQPEMADLALRRSLNYDPTNRRALLQRIIVLDAERKRLQAESVLTEALKIFPDDPSVRIQAAEHYTLYGEWLKAQDHLDRASRSLAVHDPRQAEIASLKAVISLTLGDPAVALEALDAVMTVTASRQSEVLFLRARAYRTLGNEENAQRTLRRLLTIEEDEIARIFKEEPLLLKAESLSEERSAASGRHVRNGRRLEDAFLYDRAYDEYRWARLVNKYDSEAWIAYVDLIRKMGFPEQYADRLGTAVPDIEVSNPEAAAVLNRRLTLLEHSSSASLADEWNISSPWTGAVSQWTALAYTMDQGSSLSMHPGAEETLARRLTYMGDDRSSLRFLGENYSFIPSVTKVTSFSEAFALSRNGSDYFVIFGFDESERTFGAYAEIYISRTGERLGRVDRLRTGEGRVSDVLRDVFIAINQMLPRRMSIVAVDGDNVLLNRGRWHGIAEEEEWIALKQGAAVPAVSKEGLSYNPSLYLGTVTVRRVSEPLSEGIFSKAGDFDFIRAGDELFMLPVPEIGTESLLAPDPALRSRLLSIP